MNALKTGALAVTLIIAIPILLGYGMASETTTEEYYKEVSTINMSDLILNNDTNYYGNYIGVANNSLLFQILNSNNDSWSEYAVPDYVSVSSNYSSIPTYEKTAGTLSLNSPTTTSITVNAGSSPYYLFINAGETNTDTYAYYNDCVEVQNTDGSTKILYQIGSNNVNIPMAPDHIYRAIKVGSYYNLYEIDDLDLTDISLIASGIEWISFVPQVDDDQFTVKTLDATDLPTSFAYSLDVNENYGMFYLGDDTALGTYDYLNMLGSTAYLDGTAYYNATPSSVLIFDTSVTSLSYTYGTAVSGSYADPNAGWKIPTPSHTPGAGESVSTYWTNAAVNGCVTFDLAFTGNGTVSFKLHDSVNNVDRTYSVKYSSGVISFIGSSTVPIGAYNHARLVLDLADGLITIYGLQGWSPLGETPTTYYSYTLELTNALDEPLRGEFSTVEITDSNSICNFRVASAETVAGQFPTTKNYTFSPISYYPDTEYFTLYFNSVGIYGDGLTIGGTTFTVSPLHKTVTMEYDSDAGTWTTVFNGTTMTTNSAPTIVFNGEWSATITGSFYETDTHEVTNWVAGGFAFDQDDFVLALILSSVIVFVGLGLMNGVKIGILAVVCGAAGIIAFIIA